VRSGTPIVAEGMVMEETSGERGALVDPVFDGIVPDDTVLRWRIAVEPVLILQVLDSVTGTDLVDVTILDRAGNVGGAPWLDDSRRGVRECLKGDSPLRLRHSALRTSDASDSLGGGLHVGAAGYGWESLYLAAEVNQDQEVSLELSRAGELEVLFDGAPPIVSCKLSLIRLDGFRGLQMGEGDDWEGLLEPAERLLLTGVTPGMYRIFLKHRPARASYLLESDLGQVEARVHAGQRTTVSMTRAELIEHPRVPVRGVLTVPPAWGTLEYRLTLDPIDVGPTRERVAQVWTQADLVLDAEGRGHFTLESMPTGTYVFEFVAFPIVTHRALVTVQDVDALLELAVPVPVDVRVTVVDAVTGTALALRDLYHGQEPLEVVANGRAFRATLDPAAAPGVVSFRAPLGPLRLIVILADGRREDQVFQLASSPSELLVEVH
jgi:hypothetical protein